MITQILEPTPTHIHRVAVALRRGDVIGLPTETVYGLAGSVFDPRAIQRIFTVKGRPATDPLIVHVAPQSAPDTYLQAVAEQRIADVARLSETALRRASRLAAAFWPGPLTLVLPKHEAVPLAVTSGKPTVAVRMPQHPVALAVIRAADVPLAAPSANRFGRISPTSASDVLRELGGRIYWILDGGRCEVGVESTVIAVDHEGDLRLLRPGGVSAEALEHVAQTAVHGVEQTAVPEIAAEAPGMLSKHYAPTKRLVVLPKPLRDLSDAQMRQCHAEVPPLAQAVGLLQFQTDTAQAQRFEARLGVPVIRLELSRDGDLREVARNLFRSLRALDESTAAVLFAEPCPTPQELGRAIADRLRRAAT